MVQIQGNTFAGGLCLGDARLERMGDRHLSPFQSFLIHALLFASPKGHESVTQKPLGLNHAGFQPVALRRREGGDVDEMYIAPTQLRRLGRRDRVRNGYSNADRANEPESSPQSICGSQPRRTWPERTM